MKASNKNANKQGSADNDHFAPGRGNGSVWGGSGGSDKVYFSGKLEDYKIIDNQDGSLQFVDLRGAGNGQSQKVRGIDEYAFTDVQLNHTDILAKSVNEISGTDNDDSLSGSRGNDRFNAGAGDDRIWGGSDGTDTVIYSSNLADYTISANKNGTYTISDKRDDSPDGTDVVRSIELFEFADQTVSLQDFIAYDEANMVHEVAGTDGDDNLHGGNGNDRLFGGQGDDRIWGGKQGTDTAVYEGDMTDYRITSNNNGSYTIRDIRMTGLDGTDVVRSIESFEFADITISLDDFVSDSAARTVNIIYGTTGEDNLRGGKGNDRLIGDSGDDKLWGGAKGTDTAVFSGKMSDYSTADNGDGSYTIIDIRAGSRDGLDIFRSIELFDFLDGTFTLDEVLNATSDVYAGSLSGIDEDDTLSGGNVNEMIYGGDEEDTLFGGVGKDSLHGGDQDDHLDGGHGKDDLLGGAGNDYLEGGLGPDRLFGGEGSDTAAYSRSKVGVLVDLTATRGFRGEASGDRYDSIENVLGSDFNDHLKGDAMDNILSGKAGNDFIEGRGGDDIIRGGQGEDRINGGAGFDTASYWGSTQGVVVGLNSGTGMAGDAAGDILINIERLEGSNAAGDTLFGSSNSDELFGFGGNDKIVAHAGNDLLDGGWAHDWMEGGSGNDIVRGDWGEDWLYGDEGSDNLLGGKNDDRLTGGAGNDSLWGAEGRDKAFYSGNFADYVITANANGTFNVTDTLAQRDGSDTVRDIEQLQFTDGTYSLENDTFLGLEVSEESAAWVVDRSGDLLTVDLFGAVRDNPLYEQQRSTVAEPFSDIAWAPDGNLYGVVSEWAEKLEGDGFELVQAIYSIAPDTGTEQRVGELRQSPGVIEGIIFDDAGLAYGVAGGSIISFDVQSPSAGFSVVATGDFSTSAGLAWSGGELYVAVTTPDTDIADELWIVNSGDVVKVGEFGLSSVEAFANERDGTMFVTTGNVAYEVDPETATTTYAGSWQAGSGEAALGLAFRTEHVASASADGPTVPLDDNLVGSAAHDKLYGHAGNDRIESHAGNDTISGGSGDDYLDSGSGDDFVFGGTGDDILFGDTGEDTFVFHTNAGNDEIRDWESGTDKLDFSDLSTVQSMDDLLVLQTQPDTLNLSFDDGVNSITLDLHSTDNAYLTAGDVIF